jgi:hypothetical protein
VLMTAMHLLGLALFGRPRRHFRARCKLNSTDCNQGILYCT